MKKTKKRVLGLLGLALVIITTIFAAFLPNPEASAEGGSLFGDEVIFDQLSGTGPSVESTKE